MAIAHPDPPHIAILTGDLIEVARLPLPAPALALRFSADGAGLYAALLRDSVTTIVAHTGRAAAGLRMSPPLSGTAVELLSSRNSRTLYLALDRGAGGGGVSFLEAGTLRERRRLDVCAGVRALTSTPDGERLYVLCSGDRIAEVDTGLEIVIRDQQLAGPCDATGLAVARAGAILVACGAVSRVWYLDPRTLTPFDSLATPAPPHLIATTSRRDRVPVTVPAQHLVLLVDPAGHAIMGSVEAPSPPTDLAVAGDRAYAVAGATLLAFDWETGRADRTVPVPRSPTAVASWPGPREPRLVWYAR